MMAVIYKMVFCGFAAFFLTISMNADAAGGSQTGLLIKKIRVVGDFQGEMYDNSIELWVSPSLSLPSHLKCTSPTIVYIDAKNKHLIAAAYLAFSMSKKIDVYVDDVLPIRGMSCEVSYLDISDQ
jgi:hypothetical protein